VKDSKAGWNRPTVTAGKGGEKIISVTPSPLAFPDVYREAY